MFNIDILIYIYEKKKYLLNNIVEITYFRNTM